MRTMARRRAQKRWSALLMRIRNLCLDDRLWSSFVAYAKENYYEAFLAAFKGPALHCVGPVGGSPCGFVVDLTSPDASHTLELPRAGCRRHVRLMDACSRCTSRLMGRWRIWLSSLPPAVRCGTMLDSRTGDAAFAVDLVPPAATT